MRIGMPSISSGFCLIYHSFTTKKSFFLRIWAKTFWSRKCSHAFAFKFMNISAPDLRLPAGVAFGVGHETDSIRYFVLQVSALMMEVFFGWRKQYVKNIVIWLCDRSRSEMASGSRAFKWWKWREKLPDGHCAWSLGVSWYDLLYYTTAYLSIFTKSSSHWQLLHWHPTPMIRYIDLMNWMTVMFADWILRCTMRIHSPVSCWITREWPCM